MKEFFSFTSGESVELNVFIDLGALLAAGGYQLRAKNMTAMGLQVVGTILNKIISTRDDL